MLDRQCLFAGIIVFCCGASCAANDDEAQKATVRDRASAETVLERHCADCHSGAEGEGGFSLEQLAGKDSLKAEVDGWLKVRERLLDRSMPPEDASSVGGTDEESMGGTIRERLANWIHSATLEALCAKEPMPGPALVRRLARHEYSNTVRDLLGIHFNAGRDLPEDNAGGEGFTNAAETLTISPIHAEKYLDAAVEALDYAARDQSARKILLSQRPSDPAEEPEAASENLRRLADRAFRRPATEEEVQRLVDIYRSARADGYAFDEAVLYAMRGVLISPHFLFLAEAKPESRDPVPLTDHELAARLSYFLWATMPDEELRSEADAGRLHQPDVLRKHVARMLKVRGTKLRDSMSHFVGQWLSTADLGRSKTIDSQRHPWMKDPHVAALRNQPVYVFEEILRENLDLTLLLDADWTFLNGELAQLYKIDRSKLETKFVQYLKRVDLPEEYRYRGSLLSMGGVLAVSSYPGRSSPVLRGAWVLEKMLGRELPPPPPNVPALDESAQAAKAATLRERLEQHRANPACATCHDTLDPIGFALENFDEIGRWRDSDEGGAIDSVATLKDGTKLEGVSGLKAYLLDHREDVLRQLTRKMLGYALGRSLRHADLCTVESIVQRLHDSEYQSHELVLGIVESDAFRMKSPVVVEEP